MMRSMFSGVSGLKGHQTRMDVIGNNIANVNTTGFKASRVTFADMISQNLSGASAPQGTIGGVNPKQIGLGMAVASTDLLYTNGSVQSTGKNTDIAISRGDGLLLYRAAMRSTTPATVRSSSTRRATLRSRARVSMCRAIWRTMA